MRFLRRLQSFAFLAAALFPGIISAQTLRTTIPSDIRGLMPGNSPDVYTGAILQNVYEGLVAWKSDGSVAPMLADRIEISPDGKIYTFTLRDGVIFHNGAPAPRRRWSGPGNASSTQMELGLAAVTSTDRTTSTWSLWRDRTTSTLFSSSRPRVVLSSAPWRAPTAIRPESLIPMLSDRTEPGLRLLAPGPSS